MHLIRRAARLINPLAQKRIMAVNNKDRRLKVKTELINRRGDKCITCGYAKTYSALCFHHRNPATKEFNISGTKLTKMARSKLEIETDKCDVYCLNCHAGLHDREGWVHEDRKITPK